MLIKYGQNGLDVQELQQALNHTGATLTVDGHFGAVTLEAVKKYQRDNNLVIDGVVGDRTWQMLNAKYTDAKYLTESDISEAAQALDVDVAVVKAIIRTEAPNGGFTSGGQVTCLFERHKMYQFLGDAGLDAKQYARSYPNLVNPNRGGYIGGTAENARLVNAMHIHRESALKSASYGRFQTMGFNFKACGYDDVESFYAEMCSSEGKQLQAFVQFIKSNPALLKALQARDWAQVALQYNGKGYKINQYDLKLARYYAMYSDGVEKTAVAATAPKTKTTKA